MKWLGLLLIVSILVLLDFPFGVSCGEVPVKVGVLFQSLFYWIFLSEKVMMPLRLASTLVSILVLLDFPFGEYKRNPRGR